MESQKLSPQGELLSPSPWQETNEHLGANNSCRNKSSPGETRPRNAGMYLEQSRCAWAGQEKCVYTTEEPRHPELGPRWIPTKSRWIENFPKSSESWSPGFALQVKWAQSSGLFPSQSCSAGEKQDWTPRDDSHHGADGLLREKGRKYHQKATFKINLNPYIIYFLLLWDLRQWSSSSKGSCPSMRLINRNKNDIINTGQGQVPAE